MKNKHVIVAVIATYVVISFFPQLGLMSVFGGLKGKGKGVLGG